MVAGSVAGRRAVSLLCLCMLVQSAPPPGVDMYMPLRSKTYVSDTIERFHYVYADSGGTSLSGFMSKDIVQVSGRKRACCAPARVDALALLRAAGAILRLPAVRMHHRRVQSRVRCGRWYIRCQIRFIPSLLRNAASPSQKARSHVSGACERLACTQGRARMVAADCGALI